MIVLKRLGGGQFALNQDLIERIESAPDTILVLVDGTRYIVEESMTVVIEKIRDARARLLARVETIAEEPEAESVPNPVQLSIAAEE